MTDFLMSFGDQIRQRRLRLHMSQQELADRINELACELGYDEKYKVHASVNSVSRWERGDLAMTVVQEDLIIRALLTNVADLHAVEGTTDLDVRLADAVKRMSFRSREIMHYLLATWDGNARALIEANLIYSCIPREDRADAIENLLATYNAAQHEGTVLPAPMAVDFLYVEREQEKL